MMKSPSMALALCLAVLGCSTAPADPEVAGPDEASLQVLLDSIREGTLQRKETALQMLIDAGPSAAPVLRKMLTRRETPADSSVAGLLRSLRSAERRGEAIGELLARGNAVEPDLWETVFTTPSREVVMSCVELLSLMDGERVSSAVLVEVLQKWSALPSSAAPETKPAARLASARGPEEKLGVPPLRDGYSLQDWLREKDARSFEDPVYFEPVEHDKR
jgi:hypothetical protein